MAKTAIFEPLILPKTKVPEVRKWQKQQIFEHLILSNLILRKV